MHDLERDPNQWKDRLKARLKWLGPLCLCIVVIWLDWAINPNWGGARYSLPAGLGGLYCLYRIFGPEPKEKEE